MTLGERAAGQREAHIDRWIDDRLVALCELVIGQARAAARAVRRDSMVGDKETAFVDALRAGCGGRMARGWVIWG